MSLYLGQQQQGHQQQHFLLDPELEWAKQIKEAGDSAIHRLQEFREKYKGDKLAEIILHLRMILEEDLYRAIA